jgi:hypothetical protein
VSPAGAGCALTAVSALTPVGASALETGAAVRARLSGIEEHPLLTVAPREPGYEPDEPARVGRAVTLDPFAPLSERLDELARESMRALVREAKLTRREAERAGLFVGVPEADAGTEGLALEARFTRELAESVGLPTPRVTRTRADGHPTLFHLLAHAAEALSAGDCPLALVVLVDSFLSEPRVRARDAQNLVRTQRNPDGVLLGEAGFAFLLEPLGARSGRPALARLGPPSFGVEPHLRSGEAHSTGKGLTDALAAQLDGASSGAHRAPAEGAGTWLVSDLDGSAYAAFELSLAATRLARELGEVRPHWHPLESTGDLGSATGGLLVLAALHSLTRGRPPASAALLSTSSHGPSRAALRVHAPTDTPR